MKRHGLSRRMMIGGMTALLAGCAALPPLSVEEAVRRLLRRSTERALARLEAPGGAWDRFVAGLDWARELGVAGLVLQRTLMSPEFHHRLDAWLRPVAVRAAHAAAPRLAAAIKVMGIANARAVLAGGPRAATQLLRSELGPAVIEAMFPEFRDALARLDDPLLRPVIAALAELGGEALARKLTRHADAALWDAIGDEEAGLRADPTAGGDPQLAAYLARP
jgi:hypothetical protein